MIAGGVNYSYDPLGNLTAKTDYGSPYTYRQLFTAGQVAGCINDGRGFRTTAPGPHAATEVGVTTQSFNDGGLGGGTVGATTTRKLAYDKNGNLLCFGDGALNLWYDPYNLPEKIQRFNQMQEFRYGPDLQRYLQVAGGVTTVYLERSYEKEISTDKVRFQIAEDVLIRMEEGQNPVVDYQHRDRLGSIVAVTNEFKAIEAGTERGFGPFGKPRDANWNDQNILPGANITPRGFTDHEHLNGSRLIHMNGRAYDYNLGRFLSVDPVIQFPANSQSLNPYSYIMNNPLSGTDPTGYVACDPDGSGCDLTNLSLSEVDSISVGNQGQVIVTTTGGESFQVNGVTSAGGQSLPPQSFLAGAINILGNNGGGSQPSTSASGAAEDTGAPGTTGNQGEMSPKNQQDGVSGPSVKSAARKVANAAAKARLNVDDAYFIEGGGTAGFIVFFFGRVVQEFLIAPAESTAIAVDEEDVLGVGLAVVGALAKPIRAGAKVFDVTRGGVQANRAAGKAGEAITEAALRRQGTLAGQQVTIETSTGQRAVIDFVTKQRGVVETKTGAGRLTRGQRQLFDDIQNGRQVTPRGKNAFDAGLTPGERTTLTGCRIDRICQ